MWEYNGISWRAALLLATASDTVAIARAPLVAGSWGSAGGIGFSNAAAFLARELDNNYEKSRSRKSKGEEWAE